MPWRVARAPLVRRCVRLPTGLAAILFLLACSGPADSPGERASTSDGRSAGTPLDAPRCLGEADTIVSPAGAGPVRLWMSVSRLRATCEAQDTIVVLGEGTPEAAISVKFSGISVLALYAGAPTVHGILVQQPALATRSGIRVGSTMAAIRAAHSTICPVFGEGSVTVVASDLPGVSFSTSAAMDVFPGGALSVSRNASLIPDTARVIAIWVHGVDSQCLAG